jgi:hypothetical protein
LSKSALTKYIESGFKSTFPFLEIEYPMGDGRRCDLGGIYEGYSYGIEIKISIADMNTGYGMNQEKFNFGYLAVPEKLVKYAIGYLYVNGLRNTGVLGVSFKGGVSLHKTAVINNPPRSVDRFVNFSVIEKWVNDV